MDDQSSKSHARPVALTIAGSDSGGGAGIQADIKAMQANGVFAASVITAVTAQNTVAVTAVHALPPSVVEAQLDAVLDDISIAAAKIGMLASSAIAEAVAHKVRERHLTPLVVDPVLLATSGMTLLDPQAVETLKAKLLPLATVVTPNAPEAALLAGMEVRNITEAREAARRIRDMGAGAVLVKGGHLAGKDRAVDVLLDDTGFHIFTQPFIETLHTHGTGCTYSAAITALLAKGLPLTEAVARAKAYLTEAIRHGFAIGAGHGPTDHFFFLRDNEDA
jgi:hydroxymethylpyrimidine/phosphomethylpyrimidine kinase